MSVYLVQEDWHVGNGRGVVEAQVSALAFCHLPHALLLFTSLGNNFGYIFQLQLFLWTLML